MIVAVSTSSARRGLRRHGGRGRGDRALDLRPDDRRLDAVGRRGGGLRRRGGGRLRRRGAPAGGGTAAGWPCGGAAAGGAAGGASAAAAAAMSGVIACTKPVGSQRRYSPQSQKSLSGSFCLPQLWHVLILARLRPSSSPL